jgi:tetratricopeptide (TPR) repeat protein
MTNTNPLADSFKIIPSLSKISSPHLAELPSTFIKQADHPPVGHGSLQTGMGGVLAVLSAACLIRYWLQKTGQLPVFGNFIPLRKSRVSRNQKTASFDWYQAEFGNSPLVKLDGNTSSESSPSSAHPSSVINSKSPIAPISADKKAPQVDSFPSPSNPRPQTIQERYINFIDQVIADTLKGQVRSKEQVSDLLIEQLEPQTGEIFERALAKRANLLQYEHDTATDELKQAKSTRQIRAMKTLQDVWAQLQKNYQIREACTSAIQMIRNAEGAERLLVLVQILDPNQNHAFTHAHIQHLTLALQEFSTETSDESESFELRQFALGLEQGLAISAKLEGSIASWLYEPRSSLGIEAEKTVPSPWLSWAQQSTSSLAKELFNGQALNQSASLIALSQRSIDIRIWIELIILLPSLQARLVKWFDQQPYSLQAGRHMVGMTFLNFAMIWCELSNGFLQSQQLPERDRQRMSQVCFRVTLQTLRTFAQRENFPLYGGVFASFSGESFRETITYLDKPLEAVKNTQEKARILTILGYSQRWLGNHEQSNSLHQDALNLARESGDRFCEIANLNHLSYLNLHHKDFNTTETYAQRALILARQTGDRQGEANALACLGYSEVVLAQRRESVAAEDLEPSISHLQQGLKLLEKLNDWQNQALCHVGLGLAYIAIEQPIQARPALEQGLAIAEKLGDRDLQALSHAYSGEAFYQLSQLEAAFYHACLGMYFLAQRHNRKWRQSAALVIILQGKLSDEGFLKSLEQQRSKLLMQIGVDGVDHLSTLLEQYQSE